MKQVPLAILPKAVPSFDDFFVGTNGAALHHLSSLQEAAAPVYLWGPSGTGKTHLLRALAARRQTAYECISWFDVCSDVPWTVVDGCSMVLLDDCHEFDVSQQQAAFALFVEAVTLGIQVVAAGRVPPVDLPIRDDLRTRLGWGHVFALQPLAEAQVRAVLCHEGHRRGIFLSDDVMDYLLSRFARDLKYLMRLLDRLDVFALSRQRGVTVPLLKTMLVEEGGV